MIAVGIVLSVVQKFAIGSYDLQIILIHSININYYISTMHTLFPVIRMDRRRGPYQNLHSSIP